MLSLIGLFSIECSTPTRTHLYPSGFVDCSPCADFFIVCNGGAGRPGQALFAPGRNFFFPLDLDRTRDGLIIENRPCGDGGPGLPGQQGDESESHF